MSTAESEITLVLMPIQKNKMSEKMKAHYIFTFKGLGRFIEIIYIYAYYISPNACKVPDSRFYSKLLVISEKNIPNGN